MRVKGTLLVDYIRIIRLNKDKDWGDYLKPEDWEIINGKILASNWYPLESYRRIALAAFMVLAQGKPELARAYGRSNIKTLMEVYGSMAEPGDPAAGAEKFARITGTFFDGGMKTALKRIGPREFIFSAPVLQVEKRKEYAEAFCQTMAGKLEEIVVQSGGKNVKITVEPEGEFYNLRVSWD